MRGPSSRGSVVPVILTIVTLQLVCAQYFNPKMDDRTYLDSIQDEVKQEVKDTKAELLEQTRVIQTMTKNYIGARLKHNLFKALRVLAEKELQVDSMTMAERPRQPRQDEDEDDGDSNSTRAPSQILPQVANLIKAVFGGNINLTSYVEGAAKFLPKPIGNQLVGVVKLLANNPGDKYTTTTTVKAVPAAGSVTTPAPAKNNGGQAGQSNVSAAPVPQSGPPQRVAEVILLTAAPPPPPPQQQTAEPAIEYTPEPTNAPQTTTEGDEDEDEQAHPVENRARQLNLPGLDLLGNIGSSIGSILSGGSSNNAVNSQESSKQNQTASGFDEETSSTPNSMETKMNGLDVQNLSNEVKNSLGDLIKVMPDLFKGAHDAYRLLNTVSKLFSKLEADV